MRDREGPEAQDLLQKLLSTQSFQRVDSGAISSLTLNTEVGGDGARVMAGWLKAQSAFPKEDLAPTVTAQFQETPSSQLHRAPEMHLST